MALTQVQIIQSLGEAMNWLERELSWNVQATELRHLIGRIGELYAALITNGQLAPEVNQRGYDVVSKDGERISVKTTAKQDSGGHIAFNPNTLKEVDRIMILFMNTEDMQIEILLDESVEKAKELMTNPNAQNKVTISTSKLRSTEVKKRKIVSIEDQATVQEVKHEDFTITELESGSIAISQDGKYLSPVKPHLRKIATKLGISLLNSNGTTHNTRQLGSLIIESLKQ